MRARLPDRSGTVTRDGVRVAYDVYGDGEVAILLLPAWAIVDSRLWKANVAFLARHFTVVTFDPRGNGKSDRPIDPAAQDPGQLVGDAVAVLDAAGVDRAVLVGNSFGTTLAYLLASAHPDRALGMVAIGTTLNLDGSADDPLTRAVLHFTGPPAGDSGWALYNRHHWDKDYARFVEFFISEAFPEPHSTKHIEDGVEWGLDTAPDALAATVMGRRQVGLAETAAHLRALARAISCPAVVIHGGEDRIAPLHRGQALATLLDAPLVVLDGAGHAPQARHPVAVNQIIKDFADQFRTQPAGETQPAALRTHRQSGARHTGTSRSGTAGPRVLYLSSPIGLGHARRDTAIADELRALAPGLTVDWLAQDPVTRVLRARGEHVHSASHFLVNESAHLEAEAGEHDLHAFEALRRMDEIMVANFMTFLEVVRSERYDLVIGDEAWEVDHFLHEHPAGKHTRFAWLTDFVGYLPTADGGERERRLTADYNAEMIRHLERHPGVRDVSIFVGDPDDVVDLPFGPGLPSIRSWTEEHFAFAGYVTGFDPAALPPRDELRAALGYHPEETVLVAAVGGSGVGAPLLRRLVDVHHVASRSVPGLRTVLVSGPRIDPASLPTAPGLEVRAFVPDLHRHLAACDVAAVQGGLTTTMELAATGRPFLYFPLRNHFEQQVHVRHRLHRLGVGRAMDFAIDDADAIAGALAAELHRPPAPRPVPTGGARRAAEILADLL